MRRVPSGRGGEASLAMRRRPGRRLASSALLLVFTWITATQASADAPDLHGQLRLTLANVALADLGPVVAYLERIDGGEDTGPTPTARIVQERARFAPSFLTVARGQPVDMPNVDAIYHNVFSYSKPNDFDLGLYPAGESRTRRFEHAGVVKIYCSIHENMNATILVTPGPHHARVGDTGRFVIEDVAPGRYRLTIWCERLPGVSEEITIAVGRDASVEIQWSPLSG